MDILTQLAEDKSNREIAESETLALSSVKWYVQQIYAKLGVNQRSDAVARALQLGLLKSIPSPILPAKKNNLPAQLTSFIGRQKEIDQLHLLVTKPGTRLVTLTGPGGTGKTRLALQLASSLLDAFADGVWLVELAPISDPALIPQTIINALGQVEQSDKAPGAFLLDYLQPRQLLLILDNCEHLVDACAALSTSLLQSAPHLTILASSREILGVDGEIPFRVPPLAVPDTRNLPSLEELARFDAVRLFVERAQPVSPGFELTGENAAAVVQIIQRLDGIPLAIELAVARLRLLSVNQIALRLNDAFRLLTGGSRSALPRHQTLQALIDWSYNLLSEDERCMLRSLSAFASGWTLEAAEAVGACSQDTLDLLGQLADKSLIQAAPIANGEMRYRMLETVRQYAHSRLIDSGEAAAVRLRHLDYYLHFVEMLEPRLRSREQIQMLDALGRELDNLRLALEWALQADIAAELRLASALRWFWHIRCHWAEGIAWLQQGLETEALSRGSLPPAGAHALIRAKALSVYSFHIKMRDLPASVNAREPLAEALAIYRANVPEQSTGLAWVLQIFAWSVRDDGNLIQAQALAEEALGLFRTAGDAHGMAECLQVLGNCEIDPVLKKKLYMEQLAIDKANGDIEGIATALFHVALASFIDGDYTGAHAAGAASRKQYRQVGNLDMVALNTESLSKVSLLNDDLEQAVIYLDEALALSRDLSNEKQVAWSLFWKSVLAIVQGQYDQAADHNAEAARMASKTSDPRIYINVTYLRARLARLRGDNEQARSCIAEGLNSQHGLGYRRNILLLESGHLALDDNDLARAGALWRQGLQVIADWREMLVMNLILDGLAILAMREGKLERAARLFGTRQWRGWVNALSPIERVEREADFARLKTALGEDHFAQLQEEGQAMTFIQIYSMMQAEG